MPRSDDRSRGNDPLHVPTHPVRFVTAAALFDGHDAAINIMRRILQAQGAEVIHLGHNRSVREVVDAAMQEDVQAVAISSYQGGHVEYFEYLASSARAGGAGAHPGLRRRRRRHRAGGDRAPGRVGSADLLPRGRPAAGPGGHDQRTSASADVDLGRAAGTGRRRVLAGRADARWRARSPPAGRDAAGRRPADAGATRPPPAGSGARHHRHRRVGQVLPHRRADPPAAHRPAGQAAHGGAGHRPDPAPGRRRAARRPDPDEHPRRRPGLLPLHGHPGQRRELPDASRR